MAADFIFTSPGVKFRERDLSFVQRNAGITTLGIVGEFQKGPAFEKIAISDQQTFNRRFGGQSTEKIGNNLKYQAPYVANKYLEQSGQLVVTRILGLSGYDAGQCWAIRALGAVDLTTTGTTNITSTASGVAFSNNTYKGITITAVDQTGVTFDGFIRDGASYTGISENFIVDTLSNGSGTLSTTGTTISGTPQQEYENMVLAIIKSRATITDVDGSTPLTAFDATTVSVVSNSTNVNTGDPYGNFTIQAGGVGGTAQYVVSLNPASREYISKVVGDKPKGNNSKIYVDFILPELIKKLDANSNIYGIDSSLIDLTTGAFTDYKSQWTTPETPYVVSELRGNSIQRLFKFVSISDGNSANKEIKISIQNIDPATKEFDVVVRDFNDTDENIIVLESFRRCSMNSGLNNYIGNRIGTSDGSYDLLSQYIMVSLNEDHDDDVFPAGFEGYTQRSFNSIVTGSDSGQTPTMQYKLSYSSEEQIRYSRTYLGLSEKAYNTTTTKGTSLDQNTFNFLGNVSSGTTKMKGFHLDSGATGTFVDGNTTIGEFEVGAGAIRVSADVTASSSPYNDKTSRKFSLVPAGGFDGWNVHRIARSNSDLYKIGGAFDGVPDGSTVATNDYQAYDSAIKTFDNPEEVSINLFATPGINFSDHLQLCKSTINMIEQDRADSLYIMDAPDIADAVDPDVMSNDIVDLLTAADIDSNYTAMYYPWIQVRDSQNNKNVFLPPTLEVVNSIAFNDNVAFPWFAPAGLNRGTTDAKKTRLKLKSSSRDILYDGRINPMATFPEVGVAIFGQKTLQIAESSLDRVNIRRLLLQLKVLISNVAIRLVFEQNDQVVRDQFLQKVNPILDSVKRERGLEEFLVVMDDSNNSPESIDRLELYGEIKIKPTKSVEFIGITFTVTPTGASFEDV